MRGLPTITLDTIREVAFFKNDELTTDLICCEVVLRSDRGDTVLLIHEEAPEWPDLLALLARLPGFNHDWARLVMLPPFAANRTVAFVSAAPG